MITDRSGTVKNVADAGEVDVLYGSGNGLSKTIRPPQLSAWNFGGPNTLPDLAIGVPLEDVNGISNCGAVAAVYSSSANNGLTSFADQLWHLDLANVPGSCQTNEKLGQSLY